MLLETVSIPPNPVYLLVVVSLAFVILTVLVLLLIPVMIIMPVRLIPVQMVLALTHKWFVLVPTHVLLQLVLMELVLPPQLIAMIKLTVRKILVLPEKDVFIPLMTIIVKLLILARI
jgi:hypothetical protein